MTDTGMGSYSTQWIQRFAQLEELLYQGQFQPLLLHHCFLILLPTISVLLIPRSYATYVPHLRRLVFLWTAGFGLWIMQTCRTHTVGNGYGIGILVSVSVMRSGTMILIRDPEQDFRRILKIYPGGLSVQEQGTADKLDLRSSATAPTTTGSHPIYISQDYPREIWPRLTWVISLLFSCRGSVWNWRVKPSGPLPKPLVETMHKDQPRPVYMTRLTSKSDIDSRDQLWKNTRRLTEDLLWMIPLWVIAQNDPYFWGEVEADLKFPQGWLFRSSSMLAQNYRLFVLMHLLKAIIEVVYSLLVVSWTILAIICPRIVQPDDWMIPDMFGPFSALFDCGIAGFWGTYWHQLLRFDFLTWSDWTLSSLPVRFQRAPAVRQLIYLIVPFTLSGVVHACGCYTQFHDSNGARDTIIFALAQAVAIAVQQAFSTLVLARFSPTIHKLALFATTWAWLLTTCPVVGNDYLQGGFLASTFVTTSTGWKGDGSRQLLPFMGIWRGKSWWQTGIRVL